MMTGVKALGSKRCGIRVLRKVKRIPPQKDFVEMGSSRQDNARLQGAREYLVASVHSTEEVEKSCVRESVLNPSKVKVSQCEDLKSKKVIARIAMRTRARQLLME
jgi:hypothetical protein